LQFAEHTLDSEKYPAAVNACVEYPAHVSAEQLYPADLRVVASKPAAL
jgi:hypothetical protein